MILLMLCLLGLICLSIYYWFVEKNDEFFKECRDKLKIDDIFW